MIRVETSTTIDRPVEDVARYVADIERMTEWTDMTASRRLTDGPTRAGTRAYAEVTMGPVKARLEEGRTDPSATAPAGAPVG